jgi:hypothetical protein
MLVLFALLIILFSFPARAAWNDGIDRSFNPPSIVGLFLVGTIHAWPYRTKIELMVSCKAGAVIALDDELETLTPTYIPIAGTSSNGAQGSVWLSNGFHSGRVRIFSSNQNCQVTAREW